MVAPDPAVSAAPDPAAQPPHADAGAPGSEPGPSPGRRDKLLRRLPVLAAAFILLLGVILAIVPAPPLWVDLEIRTTALAFSLAADEDVVDDLGLSFIEIDGLSSVTAYSSRLGRTTVTAQGRAGGLALRDSALTASGMSLSRLELSRHTRVRFRKAPTPGAWVLALECDSPCPGRRLQLERAGRHAFQLSGAEGEHPYDTAAAFGELPGALAAVLDPNATSLHLALDPSAQRALIEHLPIGRVSFDVLEVRGSGSTGQPRSISGIVGGTLHFPAMENRSHTMRPGQRLRIDFQRAWIEQLRFEGDTLVAAVSGKARRVGVGSAGNETVLTPKWLELLYSQPLLRLLAAFLLAGVPLSVAAIQWFLKK